jgi:hypothetical protein
MAGGDRSPLRPIAEEQAVLKQALLLRVSHVEQRTPVIASASEAIQILTASKIWIASSRSLSSGAHSRDPLAPRNDVATHLFLLAARMARELCQIMSLVKVRAQGMPGARFAPAASRAKNKKHTSVVTTVTPVSPGIPRANGFNGFLRALPGDRALLSPSPLRSVRFLRA